MNRRDFLKAAGLGTALPAMATSLLDARQRDAGAGESGQRILANAGDRIEKYRKGDALLKLVGPDGKELQAGLPVKIAQKRHKFLFGCNIFKLARCKTPQDNAAYEKRFAAMLNFATLPFYWWNYEREAGRPDDARTDEIVRWCKAHNITTKGHPLAWNWGEQKWLPDDPQAAMQLQLKRIERCVRRFKGGIDIWDVVNEATHYDRDHARQNAPKLTEAIRKMGVAAYVRAAFKAARKANPNATLLINDYRTDSDYEKKVIAELAGDSGKPLYDVIGIQSHMHGAYWGARRAWEVCDRFAKFGVPLHFTETTVVSGPKSEKGWLTTPDGEKRQAEQVTEFYTVLFSHPAVEAVTWWDFTDQGAWQQAPAGFLRTDMTPKPAYEQLKALIKDKWWTQTDATIAAAGKTRFRGFFGEYQITAGKIKGDFKFDKKTKGPIKVRLS
ncbi:MAG: endo-1,4-beta-xylanase [Planctomycetes bacterium]|nr:endo-1,4-beta-xylanase [Planctomycetota bacterium]